MSKERVAKIDKSPGLSKQDGKQSDSGSGKGEPIRDHRSADGRWQQGR
jgi:hypothetical protein